jgi:hypothetical protein
MFPLRCARAAAHFIGLVYSQFEFIKIKLKKVNYDFSGGGDFINVMFVKDRFRKSLPSPHPGFPSQPRRHHGLRTWIPGLEGTLSTSVSIILHLITLAYDKWAAPIFGIV